MFYYEFYYSYKEWFKLHWLKVCIYRLFYFESVFLSLITILNNKFSMIIEYSDKLSSEYVNLQFRIDQNSVILF